MKPVPVVVDLGKTYEQNLIDSLQRLGYKDDHYVEVMQKTTGETR